MAIELFHISNGHWTRPSSFGLSHWSATKKIMLSGMIIPVGLEHLLWLKSFYARELPSGMKRHEPAVRLLVTRSLVTRPRQVAGTFDHSSGPSPLTKKLLAELVHVRWNVLFSSSRYERHIEPAIRHRQSNLLTESCITDEWIEYNVKPYRVVMKYHRMLQLEPRTRRAGALSSLFIARH